MAINHTTYDALKKQGAPLTFSPYRADIVLFLHDVEKEVIAEWQETYGFTLSDEEINALKYIHGEGKDYSPTKNIACPLAAHVHHCDNASARIFFNDGKGSATKKKPSIFKRFSLKR